MDLSPRKSRRIFRHERWTRIRGLKEIVVHVHQEMSFDGQPLFPDVFLWMICDAHRVANVRLAAEDFFSSSCQGERALLNGRPPTLLHRVRSSWNALLLAQCSLRRLLQAGQSTIETLQRCQCANLSTAAPKIIKKRSSNNTGKFPSSSLSDLQTNRAIRCGKHLSVLN